jgi:outer membrane protein
MTTHRTHRASRIGHRMAWAFAATALFGLHHTAHAQRSSTIFPEGWDHSVRERMFMRLSYMTGFMKTKSGDAYDVTGPVVTAADLRRASDAGALPGLNSADCTSTAPLSPYDDCNEGNGYGNIISVANKMDDLGMVGMGTPAGVKSRLGMVHAMAVSMGYWLDEARTWQLEAFVLGAPVQLKAYGAGINPSGLPNGLADKRIISAKMLPPIAILSRHFGDASNRIRPYVGVGAMYAVMYGAKAEAALERYVGGKTDVVLQNAFGLGPFLGASSRVNDTWHVNLGVGQFTMRSQARLTTTNTLIDSNSGVTQDYPKALVGLINLGESNYWQNPTPGTSLTNGALHYVLTTSNRENFGTFVRKQNVKLRATLVSLSVGASF